MIDNILKEIERIDETDQHELISNINRIKEALHKKSPFKNEPVDFVKWVPNEAVYSNDYNPNVVAPPEMELLKISIDSDGYTQPIVTMEDCDGRREVIDGFHRHRVGKEVESIRERVLGYLPVVQIRSEQSDKTDRIASTIRHNRARGKHKTDAMSDIVIELSRRNWSDEKIAKNLGMDADEVLRLKQISGLAELFSDEDFSKSWEIDDIEENAIEVDDGSIVIYEKSDDRIFHTYEKWECYKAGFYENKMPGKTKDECEKIYMDMLTNTDAFSAALSRVITEWTYSCEHYLTNEKMNRIAWLGQAALCIAHGIPSIFRGGFNLLTEEEQIKANETALIYLNKWNIANGRKELTMEESASKTDADIY
jgi:hypothetical protein